MKTLGKKLIEFGISNYQIGMKVCADYRGHRSYGVVERITQKGVDDSGTTINLLDVNVGGYYLYCESTAEELRPATLLEKFFKANEFPQNTTSNVKLDSHAYPF